MAGENPGWTVADAIAWLDPPITAEALTLLIRANKVQPIGRRKPPAGSTGGRPAPEYDPAELQDLHAANIRWHLEHDSLPRWLTACRT